MHQTLVLWGLPPTKTILKLLEEGQPTDSYDYLHQVSESLSWAHGLHFQDSLLNRLVS
jgi:hypothetical protein